jgi:hypothetical protein
VQLCDLRRRRLDAAAARFIDKHQEPAAGASQLHVGIQQFDPVNRSTGFKIDFNSSLSCMVSTCDPAL